MITPPRRVLSPLLLALALAGSAGSAADGHAATATAKAARVRIQDVAFKPATLKVKVGTAVTWTNKDAVPHTVTAASGRWGSRTLNQGQSYTYTFKKAGTYAYHCTVHPSMAARIVVTR